MQSCILELHFIINTIREQYKHSSHDIQNEWHEKYIEKTTDELGLNTNIKSIIKGVVDKCLFINNDVIIIDYKTGTSATINRKYFEYGIDIYLDLYNYDKDILSLDKINNLGKIIFSIFQSFY